MNTNEAHQIRDNPYNLYEPGNPHTPYNVDSLNGLVQPRPSSRAPAPPEPASLVAVITVLNGWNGWNGFGASTCLVPGHCASAI
ncbi:hypothetical protein ACFVTC_19580 [Streptomyces sp. NPDC057950]|uniref:hypothetical protein n=1 Tax=Streptomyces sp. NPDC057950 TaxID=3346288 RepID=UPI0036E1BBD9